jgi:hypothetical protein
MEEKQEDTQTLLDPYIQKKEDRNENEEESLYFIIIN